MAGNMKWRGQPYCELGLTVYWYQDDNPGTLPCPAIVTMVSKETINCMVVDPNKVVMIPKTGVRFRDDPKLKMLDSSQSGCWEYTPLMAHLIDGLGVPPRPEPLKMNDPMGHLGKAKVDVPNVNDLIQTGGEPNKAA